MAAVFARQGGAAMARELHCAANLGKDGICGEWGSGDTNRSEVETVRELAAFIANAGGLF